MVMRRTEPRETPGVSGACPVHPTPPAFQTTLYELIAALSAAVAPDEDTVLTATVVHFLETHRVLYTSARQQYRLVWDRGERTAQSSRKVTVTA